MIQLGGLLLEEAGQHGAIAVTGVTADSRKVQQGNVFFALRGQTFDGTAFAADAARAGAAAIVTDSDLPGDPGVPVIRVEDARAAYAGAAAAYYAPQPEVAVAVTGTNGKSSIVSFVRQIWAAAGVRGASLGTLGLAVDDAMVGGTLTTPDAADLHQILRELKTQGIDHVALEASSHGLDQRRLDGMRFQAVGFTNLTRDHLDYHLDMDAYRDAKLRLFRDLLAEGGAAVVNSDDPEHMPFMFAALDRGATLLTVGEEGAYIEISNVEAKGFAQHVTGKIVGEPLDVILPLAGRFQVSNALVALALAVSSGADAKLAVEALNHLKGAKGRLELVGEKNGAGIFVDYAHTPDALRAALEALRPFASGKLTVVFGAGGDRDPGKRPLMGALAAEMADRVIVTDDNPRTEDAGAIRKTVLAAAKGAEEIGDRAEAIAAALVGLAPGDVVLVAGKGHEDYQIVGSEKRHFSDHEEVARALKG